MKPPAGSGAPWVLPPDQRDRARMTRGTFLFHLRPIRIPARTVRWTHTFGLGGSSLLLWLTLAITGILMLLVYQPVPDVAYDSVRTMVSRVRFGSFVRGVHYWSASFLVAVVALHTVRVVMTGGYLPPRRLNWIIGAGLLLGVLASAVTGYLLPWDQRAFWAITVSTGMLGYIPGIGMALQHVVRGGAGIDAPTLLNFYTFHTTVLPVLAIVLMAFHFWRVRKAGGVVAPRDEPDAGAKVMFLPDLLVREVAQGLALLAVVVLLGALSGAPIGERANAGMSPNPAKAPWYFMGFQELLIHVHPVFAVFLLPFAALAGFVALPWMGDASGPSGRWFLSQTGKRAAGVAAIAAVVACVAAVLLDEYAFAVRGSGWFLRGVIPTVLVAIVSALMMVVARRRWRLGRNECVQTLVVFLGAGFVTLTIIGVFFRGAGMALVLPWKG